MATTYMNRGRGRSVSQLTNPADDELVSIERHFEFVNLTFKYTINDLDNIIQMLRARLSAEEAYLSALLRVKKLNFSSDTERVHNESALTFQKAVRSYENDINDVVDSRRILKEKIKLEIDVLTKQKEVEEQNRRTYKSKLYDSNINYTNFRTRDIVKLQKAYVHKCDELKASQNSWQQLTLQVQQQQQQQQQQQLNPHDGNESPRSNRNSAEISSIVSNESRDGDSLTSPDHNWKGVAGLLSQMRSKASGNAYTAPLDQNKQNTKVAKLKKEIVDTDSDYRSGIITLENLRKRQINVTEETNKQLQKSIKRKTEIVKTSLMNILHSEIDSLQQEMRVSHLSYDMANAIDSNKDLQVFASHYQAQGYIAPTPFRYENYYHEGKCREVLFGNSLEDYAKEHSRAVPLIVRRCCEAVESMGGLQKEGIYRVSGRQSNAEQLKHDFEMDEERVVFDGFDVMTIATVLKMYLRELKRPLFDFNVQSRAAYNKSMPQIQRFQLLESKLASLSLAHRSTLHYVVRHLARVNANSQVNKMNIPNLAMIFTPVIFHDFNQSDDSVSSDWSPDDLFEDLILYFETLFPRAEEMARKHIEPKLNQAMNNASVFSQYSQSNLLYLGNKNAPPANTGGMATPQPVNPPSNLNTATIRPPQPLDQQQQQYPPKLTTIIGTMPTTPRIGSLQQPAMKPTPPLPMTDGTQMVRSQSETPLMDQAQSMSPTSTNSTPISTTFVQQPGAPPRQDSLSKQEDINKSGDGELKK